MQQYSPSSQKWITIIWYQWSIENYTNNRPNDTRVYNYNQHCCHENEKSRNIMVPAFWKPLLTKNPILYNKHNYQAFPSKVSHQLWIAFTMVFSLKTCEYLMCVMLDRPAKSGRQNDEISYLIPLSPAEGRPFKMICTCRVGWICTTFHVISYSN